MKQADISSIDFLAKVFDALEVPVDLGTEYALDVLRLSLDRAATVTPLLESIAAKNDLILQLEAGAESQHQSLGAMSRGALKAQERINHLTEDRRHIQDRLDIMRLKVEHYQNRHAPDFDECSLCPIEVRRIDVTTPSGWDAVDEMQRAVQQGFTGTSGASLHPAAVR